MVSREELKAKIIKELLPSLSIDPYGGYVNSKELSKKTYDSVEDYYFKVGANPDNEPKSVEIDPERVLTREDYKEIRWVLVEEIRKHPNEWKIEPESKKLTIVKHTTGRKHYKEGFVPHDWGEWKEIEKILSQTQQVSSSEQQEVPKFPFGSSGSSGSDKY